MSGAMAIDMIIPPPLEEFRGTTSSESMSSGDLQSIPKIFSISTANDECDKEGHNSIQKLLAESTAAFSQLSTTKDSLTSLEDELVSSPAKAVAEPIQRNNEQQAPR